MRIIGLGCAQGEEMNWEPYEPTLHRLMGFGAGILNLGLLLDRRERRQLPPENDRNPVVFIARESRRLGGEYWSKIRVMDTLDDMRDYARGQTVAWFVVLGMGVVIGRVIG